MATPVRDPDGQVIGAVELLEDVTEIVRQREDLQGQLTETVRASRVICGSSIVDQYHED
jgi:DNA-binding IclR family transcriptional regulator